jgi:hypothetical protein
MKTHWKKTVDKDWIGTYILPEGKPIVVKLLSVKYEEVKVKGVKGMYKVAYFAPNKYFKKPMLLSANINLKRLEKFTGTPYIEDWININLDVTLQQEMDKAFGGGKDWALRIAPTLPRVEKEELTPDSPKWVTAVTRYANTKKLDGITKFYTLSKDNEQKLIKEANEKK